MNDIKDIPNRLQCAYCIRNRSHGGECYAQKTINDEKGCLVFKPDPKGCIRDSDFKISVPLYYEFKPLNTWWDDWEVNGVDTEIRINRITGLTWDTKQGNLIIYCNCDYYVNEYQDDYVKPGEKPNLKIVK